jgi:hypothetical protein
MADRSKLGPVSDWQGAGDGSVNEKERSQKILDVMFECLSRVHFRDRIPEDRDECMEWVRCQLNACGVPVKPMGMSHAVLIDDKSDWIT